MEATKQAQASTPPRLVAKRSKPEGPRGWTEGEVLRELATVIKRTYRFARDSGWTLYSYQKVDRANPMRESGFYAPDGEELVNGFVIGALRKWEIEHKWKPYLGEHLVKFLLHDPGTAPLLPNIPPMDEINVRNGMLNVLTGELREHSPDDYSYVQLPVWYDPEAKCPGWDEFVREVFEADCEPLAWEIPGWLLRPDKQIQKAVVLVGSGANGKSTYLDGIRRLIGGRNISASSIQNLQANRFATTSLIGKLANICADLPTRELTQSDVFKQITGDDPIWVEPKYKKEFKIHCFARLLFSANNPPTSKEGGSAYYRRWVIVPFNREFTPNSANFRTRDEIAASLFTRGEMSGFLNRALEGMRRLNRQKDFTLPLTVQEALREFQSETDPLHLWMQEALDPLAPPDCFTPKEDLHRSFNQWRARGGRRLPPIASSIFWKDFRKAKGWAVLPERKLGGRQSRQICIQGVRLSTPSTDSLLEVINA
jgi:P4 family phage/plasmid primase-like protien